MLRIDASMSAQEPFNRNSTDLSAALTPPSSEVSDRFTIDYNPDPNFESEPQELSEDIAAAPAQLSTPSP